MIETSDKPRGAVPRHVAVVMDGNGRWAKARFLPRLAGHQKGVEAVRRIIVAAAKRRVPNLTLFAFSSENWKRPQEEVEGLMKLFLFSLRKEIPDLAKNNVRIRLVGNLEAFSPALQEEIAAAHGATAHCTGLNLNICVNYGGRWDIRQACARCIKDGLTAGEITDEAIAARLTMQEAGDVDLFIRTGGEQRISNFLLWQSAYSELYFTDVLWPDFGEEDFAKALDWFALRERRFGKISEQINKN
jgi:undecaprenyl diphosphate synthase